MRSWVALAFAAIVAVLAALSAAAQTGRPARDPSNPVFFRADSLRYDRELGVMVASGHVEFTREDTTLLADTVSFNELCSSTSSWIGTLDGLWHADDDAYFGPLRVPTGTCFRDTRTGEIVGKQTKDAMREVRIGKDRARAELKVEDRLGGHVVAVRVVERGGQFEIAADSCVR